MYACIVSLVPKCCSCNRSCWALGYELQCLHVTVGDAGQSAAGYDIPPQAAMVMLSTCDGRLQALMAEANLLGEAAVSDGQAPAEDVELRQAFASTLIESGTTMRQPSVFGACQAVQSFKVPAQQVAALQRWSLLF